MGASGTETGSRFFEKLVAKYEMEENQADAQFRK